MAIKINGDNSTSAVGLGSGDDDSGIKPGANQVEIVTGGTAQVTVDNTTTTLSNDIQATSATFTGRITARRDTDTNAGLVVQNSGGTNKHIFFGNGQASFGGGETAIGASGELNTNQNIVLNDGGKGIKFPGTNTGNTDANTLDDYEEGTWTATLSATGATFTTIAQVVRYTKIGNTVHLHGYVQIHCSAGAGANALSLTGLPFPAQNISNFNQGGLGTSVNRLDNSNGNGIHFLIQPNTSFLNMRTFDNVSGETRTRNLVSNDVTQANFSFQLQVTYQTSA